MTDSSELLGRTATREFVVSEADTALAVGSGSLPVLGTPVLLAWCERVTCEAVDLPDGATSVGTRIALEHLAASKVGAAVTVSAAVAYADGKLLRFAVEARDTGTQKLNAALEALRHMGLEGMAATARMTHAMVGQAYLLASLDIFTLSAWLCVGLIGLVWLCRRPASGAAMPAID